MKRIFITLGLSSLMAGCVTNPSQSAPPQGFFISKTAKNAPYQLAKLDNHALCSAYALNPNARLKHEIAKRHLVSAADWKMISSQKIKIGMSECAALIAFSGKNECVNNSARAKNNAALVTQSYHCGDYTITANNNRVTHISHLGFNHGFLNFLAG
ncbi:MAG: hypothetical protein KIT27_04070 [Legionellales bacterium]|nr:hypothetical protein [Legionellales bacterium]